MKKNTVEEALNKARKWCKNNKGWQPLCDIKDSTIYDQTYSDLTKQEKKHWEDWHPTDPEGAWKEFDSPKCKIPERFIGANGKVYKHVVVAGLKDRQNFMMVLKTGLTCS